MRLVAFLVVAATLAAPAPLLAQSTAPAASPVTVVVGFAVDADEDAIPGATVTVDGPSSADHLTTTADETGSFDIMGLKPGVEYRVKIAAEGFAAVTLPPFTLAPGEHKQLEMAGMKPQTVVVITAISPEEAATVEVHAEESQRVLGIVPNFFVVYGNAPYVPMTTKLKYQLSLRAALDPVSFAGAAFFAGINQAGATPSFVQGAKGYGQRLGAAFTDGTTDVMFGGAILPSLFHQDPRYFVQGTGTKSSRLLHALAGPFICKGDNGHQQFNISSIGGDLISGSASNIYYPPVNRGLSLTLGNAAITTGGRMVNLVLQEFVFGRFTSKGK